MPRGSRSSEGVKRTRRKGPKSKSGCSTCKTRRIKCDETRPACTKCTSGGWICDGYPGSRAGDSPPIVRTKRVSAAGSIDIQTISPIDVTEIHSTDIRPILWNEGSEAETTDIPPISQEVSEAGSPNIHVTSRNELIEAEPRDIQLDSREEDITRTSFGPSPISLFDFSASSTEHRSFSFFLQRTAPDLATFSASSFWSQVVLQIASSEKAVQHALIAIAALHEDHLREMEDQKPMNQLFSLSQYNKAIHTLNNRLTNDRLSFLITLITCHLFVYLELLRKSPEAALTQFYSGMKLLPIYNKRYAKPENGITHSDEDPNIYRQLAWTFAQYRLSVLGTFFPVPRELHNSRKNPGLVPYLGKPFSSFYEAKERLHTLLLHSFRPYHRIPGPTALEDATSMEIKLREELALHLNDWAVQLELFVTEQSLSSTLENMRAIHMLKIQNFIAIIWNSVAMAGRQTNYDSRMEQFQSVVSLAEIIISHKQDGGDSAPTTSLAMLPQPQGELPNLPNHTACTEPLSTCMGELQFEDEVTYPLFFTVIKCRSPNLRRRALSLLGLLSPTLQRARNTKLFKAIAEHVVTFEEEQCLRPVTEDMTTWPVETQRIQRVYFMPIYDRERKTQNAMFVWQPEGPGTEMKNWMKSFEF